MWINPWQRCWIPEASPPLEYGNRLSAALLGIGATGLGTAVLPYVSKTVADKDWSGLQHTLKKYTILILQLSIPCTILIFIYSEPIIQLIFQRGAFTESDTQLVGQVQAMYILQVPFYMLSILKVRLISSIKYNQILFYGALISFVLNILLNYLFMQYFGVSGIALSTAAVYLVSYIFLSVGLHLKLKRLRSE